MDFNEFLNIEPYSLPAAQKSEMLTKRLKYLTKLHRDNCPEYENILNLVGYDEEKVDTYMDLPFLPVRLFKELELKSVPKEEIVKTMTSSGTTGQAVSKIYLNRDTSSNQQKTMVKIVSDYTGSARMPMIIIDCPSVVKDRRMFSARGAGILGFSIFGSKKIYALNDDMSLDVEGIKSFLETYKGQKILLFGFTFMIWQYFYKELLKLQEEGIEFDLSEGVLIHGGGWKKLVSEAVSPKEFHDRLNSVCKIDSVHDYYGMVEQTGCIYMQCECGHLHASNFSDVIIRDPFDFSVCENGKRGIIQVVSSIPESYPGHSLLTEDEGAVLGEDDCPCGRKGKYFEIYGRIKNAEIRGCSDTFAETMSRMAAAKNALVDDTNGLNDSNGDSDEKTNAVLNKIDFLVGDANALSGMVNAAPKVLFADDIIEFLGELSGNLMKNKEARLFPDVATLGFWLRNGSVLKLKERFADAGKEAGVGPEVLSIGRGVIFHIAPSNVPVNYAYSLFSGLMCGNANVVRVPSKDFPQVRIINAAINQTLENYPEFKNYICLVKYDRDKDVNDYLSNICDVRVIWGGDKTIEEVRKSPLKPRATEVTFADRYSLAVIDANELLKRAGVVSNESRDDWKENSETGLDEKALERIASDFYNDTYLSDQNACTSPRVIAWTGEKQKIDLAKELFWKGLHDFALKKYELPPVRAVDKLSTKYIAAAKMMGELFTMQENVAEDNLVCRIEVSKLTSELMEHRGNCGYFYEYTCNDILDLKDICNDTRCQTITVIGDSNKLRPLLLTGLKGVDRVALVGHSMDFDLIWDGYNLPERFSRIIKL